MKLSDTTLFESLTDDQIDAEAGVIRGVRILGAESKRGRSYSESARNDAAKLYEGIGVNINHPPETDPGRNRDPFLEAFGELKNVRHDRSKQAVFADHHFPVSHPHAKLYVESARRFPTKLGFSHNADGDMKESGGQKIVESLTFVQSVDLVDRAATNKGLFESEPIAVKKTIKKILESFKGKKHTVADSLFENLDEEELAAEVEVAPEASPEDGLKSALRAAVVAAFDDESLDAKATADKIKKILKMQDDLAEKPAEEPAEESTEEEPAMESLKKQVTKLQESLKASDAKAAAAENEASVRKLLESEGRIATDDEFDVLCGLQESQRKTFVARLPERDDAGRPAVSPSALRESDDDVIKTFDERVKHAREKLSA